MQSNADILDDLRNRLVTGGFLHGSRLQASELRKQYGCSASTIREILFRLSTHGLVDFQEQRGFRVPQESPDLQHELTQLRIMLECEGACLSIRQGGVAWEARLTAAHHKLLHIETRLRDADDVAPFLDLWNEAEHEFHRTLIDACRNAQILKMHGEVYLQFRQQLIITDGKFTYVPENVAQHQGILAAALDRNEGLVRSRIHDHLARNLSKPLPQPV